MDYAITGIYRSGTTLCYNILSELVKSSTGSSAKNIPTGVQIGNIKIHKYHEQTPNLDMNKFKIIYSYRDILDCLSSFIIKRKTTFEDFEILGKSSVEFVKWMIEIDRRMQEKHGYAEICYEYCIGDTDSLVENIASYYDINIPESFYKDQFKIENVKKITDFREKHSVIDQYHPNHVYNGEVGRWKTFFNEEQKEIIFNNTQYLDWKYNRYSIFLK